MNQKPNESASMNSEHERQTFFYARIGILILAVLLVALLLNSAKIVQQALEHTKAETHTYSANVLFLAQDAYEDFWNDFDETAVLEAEAHGFKLQRLPIEMVESKSLAEQIDLSVRLKPDVLLLQPDGSEATKAALERAVNAKIPVIGLLNDQNLPPEVAYIGPNAYELAGLYTEKLQPLKEQYGERILIITPPLAALIRTHHNLTQQLHMAFQQEGYDVSFLRPNRAEEFILDELLYETLRSPQDRPDILICLDSQDSLSVIRTLVDNNLVGQLGVIAYYQNQEILDAIANQIVDSTLSFSAEDLAKRAIQSSFEIIETDRTSNYQILPMKFLDAS